MIKGFRRPILLFSNLNFSNLYYDVVKMDKTDNCPICGTNKKSSDKPKESKGYLECSKCDGAYILEEGESPDDFQSCQWGKLKYTESINEVTAADIEQALQGIVSFVYENDYIKFKIPEGLDVSDESKDDSISIEIYNGTKLVGQIRSQILNSDIFNMVDVEGEKITIAGMEAVEFPLGSQIDAFIRTLDGQEVGSGGTKFQGLKMVFWISAVYSTVKNSMVIKKTRH